MHDIQAKILLVRIYVSGAWNHKRYIMLAMWLISSLGWALVSMMPNQYKSSAKVHADTTNILKPLLTGLAVQGNTDEELSVISKTLLSRPNLESIARQTDMHLDYTTPEAYEKMLKDLASDIFISGNKTKVYSISYQHTNAKMAMRIVEATLLKFTDSIAGQTRNENNTATGFLNEQINDLRLRLESSEEQLADFKNINQSILHNSGGGYYQRIATLSSSVEELTFKIRESDAEINSLKSRFLPPVKGANGEVTPMFAVKTQYDDRITFLKSKLDLLNMKYTDLHPNISETVRQIKLLEDKRNIEQTEILTQAVDGFAPSSEGDNGAVNQISLMIAEATSAKNVLLSRRDNANAQLVTLQGQLDKVPAAELELIALTRDYDVINTSYNNLLTRRESASLSSELDKDTSSVNFVVLEPPMIALFPEGPPRVILYAVTFVLSLGIGVTLALLMSQISAVIINPAHLASIVGQSALIGQIEDTQVINKKKLTRIKNLIFIVSTFLLSCIFFGLIAHETIYGESVIMWIK